MPTTLDGNFEMTRMNNATLHERISEEDAAERLGFHPIFLRRQRYAGTGPAYFRVGRRVSYWPEDLDAWFLAQRRGDPGARRNGKAR
jgi:hypothetical protein